jgi:hypothetical protein
LSIIISQGIEHVTIPYFIDIFQELAYYNVLKYIIHQNINALNLTNKLSTFTSQYFGVGFSKYLVKLLNLFLTLEEIPPYAHGVSIIQVH